MTRLPEWQRKIINKSSSYSVEEKRLLVEGFYLRYLKVPMSIIKKQVRPIRVIDKDKAKKPLIITVQEQTEFLEGLYKNTKSASKSGFIVGIASQPTDDLAFAFATLMARKLLEKHDIRVRLIDASTKLIDEVRGEDGGERGFDWKVCVIHNILYDATQERIQQVRDLITKQHGVLRLVVIAGGDPITFFRDKLRHDLDGAIYLQGPLAVVKEI